MISIKKTKFTAITILALFIGMVFCSIPNGPLTNFAEDPQINESQDIFTAPKPTDDSIVDTPATRSVIDYDRWYLSESVKTDIEFNKQGLNHELANWYSSHASSSYGISQTGFMNSFLNDTDYWLTSISWGSAETDQVDFSFTHKLYCGGAGDIYFDYRGEVLTGALNPYYTLWTSGTKAVDSSDLDAQGYLYIEFWITFAPLIDKLYCYIYMHTVEGSEVVSFVQKLSITDPSTAILTMWVDYFYFQRDTITNNIRSERKYNSPTTKTHSVNPPSVAFAKEMNIYYNEEEWTYSSITPYASVTVAGGVVTVNSPTEIDYEVLFISNCTNHLAIKDVSTDLAFNPSFEDGINFFVADYGTYPDSVEITTLIIQEGYYSLEVEDSGTKHLTFPDKLSSGEYYFFLWYYIEEIGTNTNNFLFYYKDTSNSWISEEIFNKDTSTDRWHKFEFFFKTGDSTDEEMFKLSFVDNVKFYIDALGFFQTSTTIKTTQSSESQIDFDGVVADSYNFAQDSFRDYQVEIWDRCDQTLEYFYSITTDEWGHGTVTHYGGLEQKEYEIRAYTIDSYFSASSNWVDTEEKTESLTSWTAGSGATLSLETTLIQKGDNAIKNLRDSGTYSYLNPRYDPSTSWSIENTDYFFFYVYRDCSSSIGSFLINIETTWDRYFTIDVKDQCPTDQTWYLIRIATSDLGVYGTADASAIDNIYFKMNIATSLNDYLLIDDLKAIHSSKLYFTPSYPTHKDYAETELSDAWDWSEGDDEGWSKGGGTPSSQVNDGYCEFDADSDWDSIHIDNLQSFASLSRYTTITYRFWANVSNHKVYVYLRDSSNVLLGYFAQTWTIADTWIDVSVLITETVASQIDEIRFEMHSSGTASYPVKIKLDYIAFVHIDSWLPQTNDYATDQLIDTWDFEEKDNEEWERSGNVGWTGTVESGQYYIDITDSVSQYCKVILDTTYSIDTDYYTHLVIKIQSFELFDLKFYAGDSYVGGQNDIFPSDLITYVFDLSLDADWTGTITSATYFRLDHDSGNFDGDEWYKIEHIYLIHQEEMPYNTIQNSVLLESESNDYQYNLWLDHNLIGTFSDLSLIPIPQTAGTHYIAVQPFKTDGPYSTQQIFSYYYTVEANAFSVSVENFYLSDDYANLFVTSNYDCSYEITSGGTGSGNIAKEGTTISVTRITTPGSEVTLTIDFTYGSETVTFSTRYNNPVSAFYVSSYTIDIQEENIEIIWSTSKSTIDSLTVYEDGSLTTVDADTTSPSAWAKSSTIGVHYVTLIFSAAGFQDIIYSFNYEIVSAIFEINIESFHLSELYVNTYITASENGNYQVYENNTAIPSDSPTPFFSVGTSIQTDRDTTEGAFINYAIKFWNAAEDTIWFNTTYSNTEGVFFVTSYSVNIGDTTITVTWATSLTDSDKLTVYEDGALTTVNEDTTSPSDWTKSTVVGTHSVTLLFEADGYTTVAYSFNYHIYAVADFQVDIGSFQVSDNYVNTYATANYDGSYYVYEDNVEIETGTLYGSGTVIETNKNITAGITIAYAIKFVYESTEIWFNTTYSNPRTPFYLTDYRVTDGSTITITWDTTLPALDSLTIYEDGMLIEDSDPESTTTWVKNTTVGNHYVTLIFSAAGYDDIIHSFSYSVYPPIAFSVYVESFYVSDDYLNLYATATYDYTYIVYQNDIDIGSGSGMAVGTIIISPKSREAGLYNFTIVFTYGAEDISFMTWYSNLIPPLHPSNDLHRTDSQGFYNISLYTNLEFFWVDVWHDNVLIIDDSTETRYSIPKALKVGWHNITLIYSYNVSTDSEGYPIAEYNATISYEFWYETKLFYDIRIRYVPIDYLGLAIGDAFEVSWVNTYFNGKLIFDGEIDDVPDYSNYTFIANDYIRIRNNMPIHNLTITDLFGREIMYNLTIDISSFAYAIIELPVYRLGVVNNDDESHKISIRPYLSGEDWQTTPILPPGYQTEYWVCNRTYEIRILSVGSTTYDENGAMVELYDDITDYPELRTVPYVIVIPLDLVFEPEEEEEVIDKWWTKPAFIAGMSAIALIIILVAIYIVNKNVKKKERLNK